MRLRVCWVAHCAVGWAVTPGTVEPTGAVLKERERMQPVAGDRVAVKKFTEMIPSACVARKSRQLGAVRRGAGSAPAARRIFQTVDDAIGWHSRASSL